jgi:nucleoside-diphosphate-sugar epimerase
MSPNTQKPLLVITGATGFIGRNLVETLAKSGRYRLRAIHHHRPPFYAPGVEWMHADLTHDEDVRSAVFGADKVIHTAATTSGAGEIVTRPHIHTTDNAVMGSLMLRACHDEGVGDFIFLSCSIMYQSSETPVRETDFNFAEPLTDRYFPAGWTKLYQEQMCSFFAGLGRTRCTVLRHSNIYGPHDKFDLERSHVVGATVTKVLSAPPGGEVIVWGEGTEARDLLYIDDFCEAVVCTLEDRRTDPFALYNVGWGEATPVRGIVETVIAAAGTRLRIAHDLSKPTIPFSLSLDCSRFRAATGWRPRVDLETGLARTVAWWHATRPLEATENRL